MQTNSQQLENIRTTILSLLLARKGGCTLRQLDNDYCEIEGTHIPWKDLGYISLLNFLHSMSKNVQIEHKNNTIIIKGIATDKSKHVSKLVAGQKSQANLVGRKVYKPSHYYPRTAPPKVCIPAEILLRIINLINDHPEGLSKDYVLQEIQTHMPFAYVNMQEMEEQFKELSHKIYLTNNKIYPVSNKANDFDHFKRTDDTFPFDLGSKAHNKEECNSTVVVAGGDEDSDDGADYDDDDFRFIATSNTCDKKPTMNIKPTSNFIKETVSKYQDQAMESRRLEENNLQRLQDYESNKDDQFCKEFGNNAEEKRKDYLGNKNGEILINERVKFRLEKLIQNRPDGIWCAELPELYLAEYKISLNYTELGFNSVREFASQLPDIFHCVQPYDTGDFKLYYAKEEIPSNSNTVKENQKTTLAHLHHIYETNDEEALPLTLSLDVCKELIPDDTMSIGECVGYISVTDLIQNEKPYIEVIVVEVFTPSFFWIQLRKKQKTFKKFMDELHNFYVLKHDQYIVPPLVLEKGLNCACVYNGIWHRGIIKTVKPDLQVTVMFYDYGTLKTYPPDAIHYLHRMFSYLPAQAIPCGLINTRPYKGSKWTRSATHHFAIRTQMPLVATIASINVEDNSMMVTLTDTTEEEDVHINDWLVEQKLGEHGKMVCTKYRNFPFRYYLECQERFKQKFEISKVLKKDQSTQYECILPETRYQKKVPSRNTSVEIESTRETNNNNNNQADVGKEMNKKLEFLKSCKSLRKSDSVKSALSFANKSTRKLQSLYYTKLLNFKQISHSNKVNHNNNSIDNNNSNTEINRVSSSHMLSKKPEQNLHEESPELDNTKVRSNKVTNVSSKKYNIFDRYSNIPKEYANHFCIQDPEDDLDLHRAKRGDIYNEETEIKHVDWSAFCKNTRQTIENVSDRSENKTSYEPILKRKHKIPLAESCFLKAVHGSSYFAANDEDICWSANGNIQKIDDAPIAVLRDIKRWETNEPETVTVSIPVKILEQLSGNKSSVEESVESKNTNEAGSNSVKSDGEIVCEEDPERDSENREGNYYCLVKITSSRYMLLQKLRTLKNRSTNTSELDSDDLSDSRKSTQSLRDNSVENLKFDELKSRANNNESVSTDFSLDDGRKEKSSSSMKKIGRSERIKEPLSSTTTTSIEFKSLNESVSSQAVNEISTIPVFDDNNIESNEVSYDYTESDFSDLVEARMVKLKENSIQTKEPSSKRTMPTGRVDGDAKSGNTLYEDKDVSGSNISGNLQSSEEPSLNGIETEMSEETKELSTEETVPFLGYKVSNRSASSLISENCYRMSTALTKSHTESDETSSDSKQESSTTGNPEIENKPPLLADTVPTLNEPISYRKVDNPASVPLSCSTDTGSDVTSHDSDVEEEESLNGAEESGSVNESVLSKRLNTMSGRSIFSSTDTGSNDASNEDTESDVSGSVARRSTISLKETDKLEETKQMIPVNELVSSETALEISNTPVFNDIDVESDEDEWDVYVPHAKLCDILHSFGFTTNIEDLSRNYKSGSSLRITEIDEARSIESTDGKLPNELSDDERCLNNESDDLTNRPKKSVICSESNSGMNHNMIPNLMNTTLKRGRIQGKAKTLVEMLNKAKSLRKDCVED